MAKDVDLSSKEWRDIIFEGKNKDFGAYQLRASSDARHNRSMIVVVLFIAAVLLSTNFRSLRQSPMTLSSRLLPNLLLTLKK